MTSATQRMPSTSRAGSAPNDEARPRIGARKPPKLIVGAMLRKLAQIALV